MNQILHCDHRLPERRRWRTHSKYLVTVLIKENAIVNNKQAPKLQSLRSTIGKPSKGYNLTRKELENCLDRTRAPMHVCDEHSTSYPGPLPWLGGEVKVLGTRFTKSNAILLQTALPPLPPPPNPPQQG